MSEIFISEKLKNTSDVIDKLNNNRFISYKTELLFLSFNSKLYISNYEPLHTCS